jgi:hypothetical protein
MKSKKIIIFTLIISSVIALCSCTNSNTKETPSNEENIIQNNDSHKNKQTNQAYSTASDNDKDKKVTKETAPSQQETSTKNDKSTPTNNLTYKSKLGFSITFPSNWKDRYIINEDINSMRVYFKSSDPSTPKNSGFFFAIMKNTPPDEDFYDSIGVEKHITIGDKSYFVGGPTDVNLSESNKDFNIFLSMNKDCKKIIGTLKPL